MVDGLEAPYHILDRQLLEIHPRLDYDSDVLLGNDKEEPLDGSLLVDGVVVIPHHLLRYDGEPKSKVIDVLTQLESQVLTLLAQLLQHGFAGVVAADACHSNGVPDSQAYLAVNLFAREYFIFDVTETRMALPVDHHRRQHLNNGPRHTSIAPASSLSSPCTTRVVRLDEHGPSGTDVRVLDDSLDDGRRAEPSTTTTASIRGREARRL